ncbi:MAG TPA: hypothetical protein VMV62_00890 [Candidatus Paceibacterota bacterium]|nr:hypothetical protein [Candidatus Paceibacterota bacterium]
MDAVLEKVAYEVLNEAGQLEVSELVREGEVEFAKLYLLFGIDSCYDRDLLSFDEAAELYKLLAVPPHIAAEFRQENYLE